MLLQSLTEVSVTVQVVEILAIWRWRCVIHLWPYSVRMIAAVSQDGQASVCVSVCLNLV